MNKPDAGACQRCGRTTHQTAACDAGGFKKLWPGRPLIALNIRTRKGGTMAFEGPISDEEMEELTRFVQRLLSREGGIPE